jgi:hypothetical protein
MRRHLLVVASVLLLVVAITFITLGGAMITGGPWPCTSAAPLLALMILLFGASLGAVTVRNFGWRMRPATHSSEWALEIVSSGPKAFAAVIAVILGIIGSMTSAISLWIWSEGGLGVLFLFVTVPCAAACAILCGLLSRAARVPPKAPPPLPQARVVSDRPSERS